MAAALDIVVRVLDRLLPPVTESEASLVLLMDQKQLLIRNLSNIRVLLLVYDADRLQRSNPRVKAWLEELRGVAYDVEDALDDWDAANREAEPALSLIKKVRRSISSYKVNDTIERMFNEGRKELQPLPVTEIRQKIKRDVECVSSIRDLGKSRIHGRLTDKESVETMLMSEETGSVCVYGQSGIGKTTLARMIYHDEAVKSKFPVRLWISMANRYSGAYSPKLSGLETLKEKTNIAKPKFLLVLDGLNIGNNGIWEQQLKACLSHGAGGSKILVTTTQRATVKIIAEKKDAQFYFLGPMPYEDCWPIIRDAAFAEKDMLQNNVPEREGFAREVVKRSFGFPLAAQSLGSLLQNKSTVSDFRRISESEIWDLKDVLSDGNCHFHCFLVSYYELESAVRRCFSYCALLPKGQDIDVDDLIRIWMAQGCVSSEIQGREYYDELARCSFFQDFEKDDLDGHVITCKMQDVVHAFAQYLTRNELCVLNRIIFCQKLVTDRHLSCLEKELPGNIPVWASILKAEKLRSFYCYDYLPPNMIQSLKRVRLLSLIECSLKEVPSEIGNLMHLRYLNLSRNDIHSLPEGICYLSKLQTLDLTGCYHIEIFPREIAKLLNLRHLLIEPCRSKFLPRDIARLTDLRTLTACFYGEKGDNNLGCLKDLNQLGGTLCIRLTRMDEDADVDDAKEARLAKKSFLQTLRLEYDDLVRSDVVKALQPHPALKCLDINASGMLPSWITATENLRKLTIVFNVNTINSSLPPLGKLRNLRELYVEGLKSESLGHEFLGLDIVANQYDQQMSVFPLLEKLRFVKCVGWRKWKDINKEEIKICIMPRLQNLELFDCPDLEILPHRLLKHLQTLIITRCTNLDNCYKKGAEHEDKISHIKNVMLKGV